MKDPLASLNRRLAERVFLGARKDVVSGHLPRRTVALLGAYALSIAILATPVLLAGGGLWVIVAFWPNLLALVPGIVLICAGLWLRPRRPAPPAPVLRRSDLPASFDLLDRVCTAMDAPQIAHIHVFNDFNAFLFRSGQNATLGIGSFLWLSLDDREKVALMAHEVAHLVNNDAARSGLVFAAAQTLDGWIHLAEPAGIVDHATGTAQKLPNEGIAQDIVSTALLSVFRGLQTLLRRLAYLETQRAEYLADALAARVAGVAPTIRLLEKLEGAAVIRRQILEQHVTRGSDGAALLHEIGREVAELPDNIRALQIQEALDAGRAIDSSHPPTAYRIAFLETLPAAVATADGRKLKIAPLDAEWAKVISEAGQRFVEDFEVQ